MSRRAKYTRVRTYNGVVETGLLGLANQTLTHPSFLQCGCILVKFLASGPQPPDWETCAAISHPIALEDRAGGGMHPGFVSLPRR